MLSFQPSGPTCVLFSLATGPCPHPHPPFLPPRQLDRHRPPTPPPRTLRDTYMPCPAVSHPPSPFSPHPHPPSPSQPIPSPSPSRSRSTDPCMVCIKPQSPRSLAHPHHHIQHPAPRCPGALSRTHNHPHPHMQRTLPPLLSCVARRVRRRARGCRAAGRGAC